ncbi:MULTISPECIES: MGH1-like glycoside hydrolase domain-containing protein [Paenibacillus]|uniref:MGH1-like glycoside hydrolase domain-containing protein n=1 Tax=Paenibacillus TaxID=44249 RepID=UPI00048BCF11
MGEMGEMGVLERLRKMEVVSAVGGEGLRKSTDQAVLEEFAASGVKFAANEGSPLERVYYAGVRKLLDCIVPSVSGVPVLHEGGVYLGTWLESTGTINTELLSRFVPSVAQATFTLFADYQRSDGLMPYKVTGTGPAYRQIQMVTPLARSVWNHYRLNGRADREFLDKMYRAMERHDAWLAAFRDTRGTGCVEAFCTFDTGHDLSPRFWHVPDTSHLGDPRRYDPDSPVLPFLAPDLTANVYCQRRYLADIAAELGAAAGPEWAAKAEASLSSLMNHCYDAEDGFFYDVDASGQFVRIQSDVLLRVLACEVGDGEFFASSLRRYLLNTRKFFAKYPFTSIAMDDPRFDPSSAYNTWAGTTNFLSLIRAPHAFEYHGRHVELTWVLQPILSAMARMERFAQCLSPWTGEEGFTETYSPAILCLLDYVERLCGILPTPEEELWFTGLLPYPMDHGEVPAEETAYARKVDGTVFELVNTREGSTVYRDGEPYCRFPYGTRLVTDRRGEPKALIGMSVRTVEGLLEFGGRAYPVNLGGNEVWRLNRNSAVSSPGSGPKSASAEALAGPGVVLPTYH